MMYNYWAMLQNFILCVNAVIPSAIYLIIGITLKLLKVVNEEEVKRFTRMTFIALYPFLMFDNIYGKNIGENMNWTLVLYCLVFLAFEIATSSLFVHKIEKDRARRATMVQAMFRSNIVLMGLPIAINLFGKGNVTSVAVILMFVVPAYNIIAVILFENARGGKVSIANIAKGVITNPLIIGGLVAGVVMIAGITLPQPLYSTIVTLSDATTPIAMILLGASLKLKGFSKDKRNVAICTFFRLVVFPGLAILGSRIFDFRGVDLIAIILMTATPTALASFTMAASMGGKARFAGEVVVITSIAACFTMPIWLFLLKTGGLF